MSSSKKTIVITGATGTNGRDLARVLSTKYSEVANVRLLVRDVEKSKATLSSYGTLVKGDLSDPASLDEAFKGADAVFLLIPFVPNSFQLATNAVEAAKRQKVGFILDFSAQAANSKSELSVWRDHGLQTELVAASGIDYATIQPTFFMSNLLTFNRATLESQGVWYSCTGTGKHVSIDPNDIAEVAAVILTSPSSKFKGKIIELTGNEPLSDNELAELASNIWGKKIKYIDVPSSDYKKTLLSYQIPEDMVNSLVALQLMIAKGDANTPNNNVEQILGRKPNSWKNYLANNKL